MAIYVVLAWDDFYPSPDNSLGFFLNKQNAEEFLKNHQESIGECDWKHQHYEIVTKRVK